MSKALKSGVEIIEKMSREFFYLHFIRGVCRTRPFASLVSFKAKNLSEKERIEVRAILSNNGIPFELTSSEQILDDLAAAISARAVALK